MGNIPPSILRQPPLPPRHHSSLMAVNKEKGNTYTGMVGGNRTRTYYFRRCKRKRSTNIESLPDDLLMFEILVRLPAQDIYERARLVCRKWYHMIYTHNFIYAQLQHTTCGLLFHCMNEKALFMAVREGRIEISKLNYEFRFKFWTSCNGLILERDVKCGYTLYIANPVTNQMFVLPRISRLIINNSQYAMAYAAASMEYKVVVTYPPQVKAERMLEPCVILTVGVDKSWRTVRTEHLPLTVLSALLSYPLVTEGFVHWATSDNQILTLNVETETMTETSAPIPQPHGSRRYLSTGRYLSVLITCGEFLWEVWEMKPQTGEWRKLPDINLEAQKHTFKGRFGFKQNEFLIPVGWLNYPEVLVFSVSNMVRSEHLVFSYNLLKQEIDSIEVPPLLRTWPLVHRNSLVWLAGC